MGSSDFKPSKVSRILSASGLLVASSILLLSFQNCGKAGMEGGDYSSMTTEDTPDVRKYKAAPFPLDVNINQVAYMTCPAVKGTISMGEDVEAPFFTIRGGAYDNRVLATRYPTLWAEANAMTPEERTSRLSAGVGFSYDFMNYMKTNFSARLANMSDENKQRLYRDALMNTTYQYKPTNGLVLQLRNSSNGFAWSSEHAKGMFQAINSKNFANQISAMGDLGTYGGEKLHEITGVETPERTYVSSIQVSNNETERDQFRSFLMNYEFVMGFTEPALEGDVFSLASPTKDNNQTLFGKTYRFTTTRAWPGRVDRKADGTELAVQSTKSDFLTGVQEFQTLSRNNAENLTTAQGQAWDCFALMVVRDVDRRDPLTMKILDPGEYDDPQGSRNCTLWDPTCTTKMKFYDYRASSTSPVIPAARTACPIQEVGTSTRYGSINYGNGLNRMRLEIARRFLPAEYWDVNTHPEYMCAVPRASASALGSCYSSGDTDSSKYILYSQVAVESVNGTATTVNCGRDQLTGTNQKECPAFINICYRKK